MKKQGTAKFAYKFFLENIGLCMPTKAAHIVLYVINLKRDFRGYKPFLDHLF